MLKLLVVDDEKWVRLGLRHTIPWDSLGVEWIGEAEDGEEALHFAALHAPDLIITDIKMPSMDGLTFIEQFKSRNTEAKIIIISGYNDFSYAQKAVKYGAFDYVLKPIEEQVLMEVVSRCVGLMKQEQTARSEAQQIRATVRESLPLARRHLLELILTEETPSYTREEYAAKWQRLHIPVSSVSIVPACLTVHSWGDRGRTGEDRSLLRFALGNLAEELIGRTATAIACPLDRHGLADAGLLISASDNPADWRVALDDIVREAAEWLGLGISIGTGLVCRTWELSHAFQKALAAMTSSFYEGAGRVYLDPQLQVSEADKRTPLILDRSWETRLHCARKKMDAKAYRRHTADFIDYIGSLRGKYSPLAITREVWTLLHNLTVDPRQPAPRCTFAQLEPTLNLLYGSSGQDEQVSTNHKQVIELALDYIESHYHEGISMQDAADHLFLNGSYFCKLFHDEMGQTFGKYLVELRMRKAKYLLKQTRFKVYEVAERVGYKDFRHFAKMFKFAEGVTPQQFRQHG